MWCRPARNHDKRTFMMLNLKIFVSVSSRAVDWKWFTIRVFESWSFHGFFKFSFELSDAQFVKNSFEKNCRNFPTHLHLQIALNHFRSSNNSIHAPRTTNQSQTTFFSSLRDRIESSITNAINFQFSSSRESSKRVLLMPIPISSLHKLSGFTLIARALVMLHFCHFRN